MFGNTQEFFLDGTDYGKGKFTMFGFTYFFFNLIKNFWISLIPLGQKIPELHNLKMC